MTSSLRKKVGGYTEGPEWRLWALTLSLVDGNIYRIVSRQTTPYPVGPDIRAL